MFFEVNKNFFIIFFFFLSFFILVHVGILYSGKFFLTVESWGTKAVVITGVLCMHIIHEVDP